jgi:hypothetical protein
MSYKANKWGKEVISLREPVKKRGSWKRVDLSTDSEESPLLEAVIREQLVKT